VFKSLLILNHRVIKKLGNVCECNTSGACSLLLSLNFKFTKERNGTFEFLKGTVLGHTQHPALFSPYRSNSSIDLSAITTLYFLDSIFRLRLQVRCVMFRSPVVSSASRTVPYLLYLSRKQRDIVLNVRRSSCEE
jgi:hypothetical protein